MDGYTLDSKPLDFPPPETHAAVTMTTGYGELKSHLLVQEVFSLRIVLVHKVMVKKTWISFVTLAAAAALFSPPLPLNTEAQVKLAPN